MKGVQKRKNKFIFRVNSEFYSEELILKTFGDSFERVDKYFIFEVDATKFNEDEIYNKFNLMLEEIA